MMDEQKAMREQTAVERIMADGREVPAGATAAAPRAGGPTLDNAIGNAAAIADIIRELVTITHAMRQVLAGPYPQAGGLSEDREKPSGMLEQLHANLSEARASLEELTGNLAGIRSAIGS
jgi:hypothetical protein